MSKKIKIKLCPVCKSSKIDLFAGGYSGTFYCKNCKYQGPIIIEKDVKIKKPKKK